MHMLRSNEKILRDKNAQNVSARIGMFTVSLCQNNTLTAITSS